MTHIFVHGPRSPTEASKKFEGLEPDSEHGEKDTDSDEDPVTQSQAHTISSDSQSVQVDSSAGSQKSKESSKLPEDDSAQTRYYYSHFNFIFD